MDNPPELSDLKDDLKAALSSHSEFIADLQEWESNLRVKNKLRLPKNRSKVQPKLIRKQAEWTYSDLSEPFLSKQNLFDYTTDSIKDNGKAVQDITVLNKQFNTSIDKVRLIDTYSRDLVNEGSATIRVGWDYQKRVIVTQEPTYSFGQVTPDSKEGMAISAIMSGSVPLDNIPKNLQLSVRATLAAKTLIYAKQSGYKSVNKERIVVNTPTVEIIDNSSLILDPLCKGDAKKAQFAIYEFFISTSDMLKQNDKYFNIDKIGEINKKNATKEELDRLEQMDDAGLEAVSDINNDDNISDFNYKDSARKLHKAYEYWGYRDFNNTGIAELFVCTWVGETIVRLQKHPIPELGLPFERTHYMPRYDRNHGEPDGELIVENQKIYGATMRGMVDILARSANGQIGFAENALSGTEYTRFKNGLNFSFRANTDPDRLFKMFKYEEIPASAHQMLQFMQNEAETLSGTQPFGSEGIKNTSSATGLQNIVDATSKRRMSILRRMASSLKRVGSQIIAMNEVFLTPEEIERIADSEYIPVENYDFSGKDVLTLSISTPEHDNVKASELAFMLQTNGPSTDPEEVRIIKTKLARLRNMPDLAEEIQNFQPTPDPIAEEIKKLQVELLKAQIANEYGKAYENQSNGKFDEARVNTEVAKAIKLKAEADMIDLNYVEKETGTEQERKKELAYLNHLSSMAQHDIKNRVANLAKTTETKQPKG